jgi:hypothetical protein
MRWPVIAEFKYKDNLVNLNQKIRIRAFEVIEKSCALHSRYPQSGDNCSFCGKPLQVIGPKVLYALYTSSPALVNLSEVLARHTILKWKSMQYRIGQPSVIAYAQSLDQAIHGLEWWGKEKCQKEGVEVSFDMKPVTQEELSLGMHQAKKEKIIKKI